QLLKLHLRNGQPSSECHSLQRRTCLLQWYHQPDLRPQWYGFVQLDKHINNPLFVNPSEPKHNQRYSR
ncbi:MAG TPA: hypothetical protein PLA42_00330, partial [Tenuifilaceae bacterium]|nr:hypothetical protein [Tenuifilaceae bacterium]